MAQKQFAEAIANYEQVMAIQETTVLAVKIFRARIAGGQDEAALDGAVAWLGKHPGDIAVTLTLAERYQQRRADGQAIKAYEKINSQAPDNIVALNNLAWLYHTSANSKALGLAERTFELAPRQAEVVDTLGWILVEAGKPDRGVMVLERAVALKPDNPEIRYHYGIGLIRSGDKDRGASELEKALSNEEQFGARADALKQLQALE